MLKSFIAAAIIIITATVGAAQELPAEYKGVLDALGRQGDFKDGVLKVNIPRSDYWGQGPAQKLAAGVRAAVDLTGPRTTR